MKSEPLSLPARLEAERLAVESFLAFFEAGRGLGTLVYREWTAREVLGHIASWHESFARNLLDAAEGRPPDPFRGSLAEVNEAGVRAMAGFAVEELTARIRAAQALVEARIADPAVTLITYKRGSRPYAPLEHLEVVQRHVEGHLEDLRAAYGLARRAKGKEES